MPHEDFIMVHSIVEANGKTIRENNLEIQHKIPIGTLVEVKYDNWYGNGACEKTHARLWVVEHTRDCDGTPLYSLGRNENILCDHGNACNNMMCILIRDWKYGFAEESLTPIEVTSELIYGTGALSWSTE